MSDLLDIPVTTLRGEDTSLRASLSSRARFPTIFERFSSRGRRKRSPKRRGAGTR